MSPRSARLGLRANAAQFFLLVGLNAFVGAMVGLERSVLPLIGKRDFGLTSKSAVLSFVLAFGIAKALANLAAGGLADRVGRKRLLVVGWLLALPVPVLIALAPNWGWIVAANLLLGANQGLAWSMTVVMKIDLVGPARRGLALGFNESAGYVGVAATALVTGALAASFAPRTLVWSAGAVVAVLGTAISLLFVRDTAAHVAREQLAHGRASGQSIRVAFARATLREPTLRAYSQAGLVNNLNDALAWGLVPLYLAAHNVSTPRIGVVAAVYPAVWGIGQIATGWASDFLGRKPLIATGMLVQGGALALLAGAGGSFAPALASALLLGVGTALVYPTLIAAVSDAVEPSERAQGGLAQRRSRECSAYGLAARSTVSQLLARNVRTRVADEEHRDRRAERRHHRTRAPHERARRETRRERSRHERSGCDTDVSGRFVEAEREPAPRRPDEVDLHHNGH